MDNHDIECRRGAEPLSLQTPSDPAVNLLSSAIELQNHIKVKTHTLKVELGHVNPIETQALWDELLERLEEGSL